MMSYTLLDKVGKSEPDMKNKKRELTLHVPKNVFNRLQDRTTESEKSVALAEEKARQNSESKKASHEMTKNWDNAVVNLKKRRHNELLSRQKKVEEERTKLMRKLTEENAMERAKIVKEAQKLLMYKKPECRLINSALSASECFRELNAQLEFNKMLKGMTIDENKKWAEKLKKDVEEYEEAEKKKIEERWNKMNEYRDALTKQLEQSGSYTKKLELEESTVEKMNFNSMIKELEEIEKTEAEQLMKKKEELHEMFLGAIEDKKKYEEKLREDLELENQVIQAYVKTKEHLNKTIQQKEMQLREMKLQRSELMAKKCAAITKPDDTQEEERLKKAQKERDQIEMEKEKARKEHAEKMRAEIWAFQKEYEEEREKRRQENQKEIDWETWQRIKRDEYDKQTQLEEAEKEVQKKREQAESLRKQMEEREIMRKEEQMEDDHSIYVKNATDRINEKILAYGQQVLEESKGVRPLFPIIKTIEKFKKENGLTTPKKIPEPVKTPDRKIRMKRPVKRKELTSNEVLHLG